MINGNTISLRPLDKQHLEHTLAWVNNPDLMHLLNRAEPVSAAEHQQWFAALQNRTDCLYLAVETTGGKHAGNVWLHAIDNRHHKAELRIMIDQTACDRGLGTEAISLLTKYAFENLNLHKVYAYVLEINRRARKAFEKAGFAVEGILREDRWSENRYVDVYLLGTVKKQTGTAALKTNDTAGSEQLMSHTRS